MSQAIWSTFAVLMISIATALYLLGYRWTDSGAMALGAAVVIVLMSFALLNEKRGRRK